MHDFNGCNICGEPVRYGEHPGLARKLFNDAFLVFRDARSDEYKDGVLKILMFRAGEINELKCPHIPGSAQSDAWYSGTHEGKALFDSWRRLSAAGKGKNA